MDDKLLVEDDLIARMKSSGLFFEDDLQKLDVSQDILNKVPTDMCRLYHIMPVSINGNTIMLVSDSSDAIKHQWVI